MVAEVYAIAIINKKHKNLVFLIAGEYIALKKPPPPLMSDDMYICAKGKFFFID